MTHTTVIDGYEGFDSAGSLALQIGGDDVLHLRAVAPEGATHQLTEDQHQAVNDAVLAALGLTENPLLIFLRAILPYAESRAEDMVECADEAQQNLDDSDLDDKNLRPRLIAKRDEARASADKAVAAVDAAKALLASLDAGA